MRFDIEADGGFTWGTQKGEWDGLILTHEKTVELEDYHYLNLLARKPEAYCVYVGHESNETFQHEFYVLTDDELLYVKKSAAGARLAESFVTKRHLNKFDFDHFQFDSRVAGDKEEIDGLARSTVMDLFYWENNKCAWRGTDHGEPVVIVCNQRLAVSSNRVTVKIYFGDETKNIEAKLAVGKIILADDEEE